MLGGVWWNVCMDEKGYVGAYMFMVSVVEYVIGKVNVMVEYMLGGMHDIVVSVCGGAVYSTFINGRYVFP